MISKTKMMVVTLLLMLGITPIANANVQILTYALTLSSNLGWKKVCDLAEHEARGEGRSLGREGYYYTGRSSFSYKEENGLITCTVYRAYEGGSLYGNW